MRSSARSVSASASSRRRSSQRRVSSYSVKMISRRSFQLLPDKQIGFDPLHEPVHARIGPQGGGSAMASMASTAASSARKSAADASAAPATDAASRRRLLIRFQRRFRLIVLEPKVFGLVGRAAVHKCLRGSRR